MDISLYYQIFGIGVLYEKGGQRGKGWRIGERKRLRDEILFWQNILGYISREQNGIPCHEALFTDLASLCRKYKLPNYERVLDKKEELIHCNCIFERDGEEESKLRGLMERLLQDARNYLYCTPVKLAVNPDCRPPARYFYRLLYCKFLAVCSIDEYNDKEMVYRILIVLHNLPRAMYGKNVLNPNAISISYHTALMYAEGCMDDKMKKEYEKYLV